GGRQRLSEPREHGRGRRGVRSRARHPGLDGRAARHRDRRRGVDRGAGAGRVGGVYARRQPAPEPARAPRDAARRARAGANGPVSIPPNVQLSIGRDGAISVVPQGQGPETLAQVGRIKLVNPPREALEKRPDGLVRLAEGEVAEADAGVQLISGYIESSNVNAAGSLVSMIELARQFELGVRMMRVADENAERAGELARVA